MRSYIHHRHRTTKHIKYKDKRNGIFLFFFLLIVMFLPSSDTGIRNQSLGWDADIEIRMLFSFLSFEQVLKIKWVGSFAAAVD